MFIFSLYYKRQPIGFIGTIATQFTKHITPNIIYIGFIIFLMNAISSSVR